MLKRKQYNTFYTFSLSLSLSLSLSQYQISTEKNCESERQKGYKRKNIESHIETFKYRTSTQNEAAHVNLFPSSRTFQNSLCT